MGSRLAGFRFWAARIGDDLPDLFVKCVAAFLFAFAVSCLEPDGSKSRFVIMAAFALSLLVQLAAAEVKGRFKTSGIVFGMVFSLAIVVGQSIYETHSLSYLVVPRINILRNAAFFAGLVPTVSAIVSTLFWMVDKHNTASVNQCIGGGGF